MKLIKNFPPSLFASVMGTGALAITSKMLSKDFQQLEVVSKALTYLNLALFLVLLIPWVARWVLYKEDALKDLRHPVVSHFYGTIAIAMLILSADLRIVLNLKSAYYLWIAGVIMTIVFSLLIPYIMFTEEEVNIKAIGPAWFIPPVGLIVIPMTCLYPRSGLIEMLLYFSWSSGFFLYLALFSIVMLRFIRHEPLPCGLAPSIWINLGPIGAGTASLLALLNGELKLLGALLWGFGVWWLIMAILLTLYYLRRLSLPYSIAWWAFIFPLGAYTSATLKVASITGNILIKEFGMVLYLLLWALWIITSIRSIVHLGKIIAGD
ncbi:tellurite-resistance/dicarboxylate transporter [Pyrococcus sp. ST04]|uniref:tellurite-resistance/dicarboxylate transporter n=1 Tax=Pyrococcus sp. ST04 TaxID=1183377 RepID=UPI0002605C17|nr:tellurite-resistance/dicarboxylate transporter [Pyrococcus sp. ST04]AFK22331.1 C4-dicarboxylate transporter [Pyrococcus sp. ST04]